MELDDLKQTWQELDEKLDASLRLKTVRLHTARLNKAETATRRLARWLWIEIALGCAVAVCLGSFLADHVAEPRFLLPAAVLQLANILLTIAGIRQLVALRALDYGEPIVAVQKRLEALRVERLRATKWALLCGPLLWTPLLIVSLRGLVGLDAYAAFARGYLLANLLFGAAVILPAIWVARRYGVRMQGSPLVQRLMRDLGGHNLNVATASLNALAQFEKE